MKMRGSIRFAEAPLVACLNCGRLKPPPETWWTHGWTRPYCRPACAEALANVKDHYEEVVE